MGKRRNWLGAIILLVVLVPVAVWAYTLTPQGRTHALMIYGSTLVRPDDSAVAGLVEMMGWENKGRDDQALIEIHDWVYQNIMYTNDRDTAIRLTENLKLIIFAGEEFQSSADSISTGKGDCEDMAILTLSLIKAAGGEGRVVLGTYLKDNNWVGHAWVEIRLHGVTQIVDTTTDSFYVETNRYSPVAWFDSEGWGWYD